MNILLEYLVVFFGVLVINIFIKKFNKKHLTEDEFCPEMLYLKNVYKISLNKINKSNLELIINVINAFIITTIYIIIIYLLDKWILRIVLGVILLILLIIICYGLLGRYYLKKEGE